MLTQCSNSGRTISVNHHYDVTNSSVCYYCLGWSKFYPDVGPGRRHFLFICDDVMFYDVLAVDILSGDVIYDDVLMT